MVTDRPSHCTTRVRHPFIRRPSTSTVQVPHAPSLHPFLAPVSPMSSRSQSSRVVRGETTVVRSRPLSRSVTCTRRAKSIVTPISLPSRARGKRVRSCGIRGVRRSSGRAWCPCTPCWSRRSGVTTTGAHQVGIDFSGHLGLVREIDGRAARHDAPPGAVYVTGRSPITWLEVGDPTEALEIYPDRDLVDRLAGDLRVTAEVRPSFAEPDGVVFAVASRLRRAHLEPGPGRSPTSRPARSRTCWSGTCCAGTAMAGPGAGPRAGRGTAPGRRRRRGRVHPRAPGRRDHPGRAGRRGQPEPVPLRPVVPRDDRHDAARLRHRAPADGRAGPAAARRRQRDRDRPVRRVLEHQPLPQAVPAALRPHPPTCAG